MEKPKPQLSAATEKQRERAQQRFSQIRPFLEDGVPLTHLAERYHLPVRTLRQWVQRYRQQGLVGLVRKGRSDRGTRRGLPLDLVRLIEGLALQKPPRSIAAIHRQVTRVAAEQGWPQPGYSRTRDIVHALDPALVTLAHEGTKIYCEKFDLIYRREASRANAMWQADHTFLDIWLQGDNGKPARPWLTIILDDYSRAIAGYRLGFQAPTAFQTALTLRQAIWRKDDPQWHVCGIPSTFYTDHGSDFTSRHLEQVAADLKIELIFSSLGVPRGRGKIERFFSTVNQMFLSTLSGYGHSSPETLGDMPLLSLQECDARFQRWLLWEYHTHVQQEIKSAPQARWEMGGFLPRMPDSLEQLDLLLLTVAKARRIRADGIHFQGQRYLDPMLAAYVGEEVTIRYDPRDMAEIRVFYRGDFLCRAICPNLAGDKVSLKEIIQARNARRRQVRKDLSERQQVVETYLAIHCEASPTPAPELLSPPLTPRLKRYANE